MSTTIVGVFNSRQQAEDALYSLRNQLEAQNVAIIVRDDETASKQMSTGMAGGLSTNIMGQLTQNAMELGGTAGQLAGRVAALAATAAFTLPAAMMGPMLQGMMGSSTIPTMANQMMSGMSPMNNTMSNTMNTNLRPEASAMAGTFQSATPQGISMVGGSGTMGQGETVVLTIYADENLNQAVDILRNHGAQEVNTYSGC
ncbi:MAG: hypothetical protein WA118_00120 [Carboxydocellales bacterium]